LAFACSIPARNASITSSYRVSEKISVTLTLIPAALVIVQPDLGSGLVYIVIGIVGLVSPDTLLAARQHLVTAIEVLSPTNKRGRGRREYLAVFAWERMTFRPRGERFEVPAFHELALSIQTCTSD
jgi:hypothetical protein